MPLRDRTGCQHVVHAHVVFDRHVYRVQVRCACAKVSWLLRRLFPDFSSAWAVAQDVAVLARPAPRVRRKPAPAPVQLPSYPDAWLALWRDCAHRVGYESRL
jgi:hypothetical protein